MGIGAVMIYKIYDNSENSNVGCYEISSINFDIDNFYMCIYKSEKIIKFFATKNFEEDPIRVVDYNKDEKIGCIPGIPMTVFTIALRQAFKAWEMDTFPEHLHYMA